MTHQLLAALRQSANLPEAVARLQPMELHALVRSVGLEDCGDIVALATPEQLARVFDDDLWHSDRPGLEARFDADRFGLWLEVLVDQGAAIAADKLAGLDLDFVAAALTQHLVVLAPRYRDRHADFDRSFDIGGYTIATSRGESWDAYVDALVALEASHPEYLRRLLRECCLATWERFEIELFPGDALDPRPDQMSDAAFDREWRRDRQGFVSPIEASAFLDAASRLSLGGPDAPGRDPLVESYARRMGARHERFQRPGRDGRALLPGHPAEGSARLTHISAQMRAAYERDPAAYAMRQGELGYLTNTLFEACTVNSRRFAGAEAYEAAASIVNLGLENWPRQWSPITNDFLVGQDLVTVFRVGWAILYERVTLYAARRLDDVLAGLVFDDRGLALGEDISDLRRSLGQCIEAGTPWRVCGRLDVIAILDLPTWAVLLGILDRCPVVQKHAGRATDGKPALRVNSEVEFISQNRQIDWVRAFLDSLLESLVPGSGGSGPQTAPGVGSPGT